MAFEKKAVRSVIEILHDGEKGFQSLGEKLQDPTARSYFMEEATKRGKFATELETAYRSALGEKIDEGGTATGTVQRMWGELKGKMGGGDRSLLETAEQGEDVAVKAYKEVLTMSDVPAPIVSVLRMQQTQIEASHDRVRALRDSTPA